MVALNAYFMNIYHSANDDQGIDVFDQYFRKQRSMNVDSAKP